MKYTEKICNIGKRGSFTVEAALIMPVVLGVIVTFIYIAMFCHDRCAIEYACRVSSAKAAYDTDPELTAAMVSERNLDRFLILDWDTGIETDYDDETVTTRIEATCPVIYRTFIHSASAYRHFCPKY